MKPCLLTHTRARTHRPHHPAIAVALATLTVATLLLTACASSTDTTPTAPTAPTDLTATPGDTQAEISFTPGHDGGSPLTNHAYSLDDGATWTDFSPPVTTSPATITGLANGTTYTVRLRAVNATGAGAASAGTVVTPNRPFTVIGAGGGFSAALEQDGSAWAWGFGGNGRLGTGNDDTVPTPRRLRTPVDTVFVRVDVGGSHSLAIDQNGAPWAWGYGQYGQLGLGEETTSPPAPISMPSNAPLTSISAGGLVSAGIDGSGRGWAWGYGLTGALGNGSNDSADTPQRVSMPVDTTFTTISAGTSYVLAIDQRGAAWAWGSGISGTLGNRSSENANTPQRVVMPTNTTFTAVSAGFQHSLAIDQDGAGWAWGHAGFGRLGIGSTTRTTYITPQRIVMPPNTTFVSISAGMNHSLALDDRGNAWAWGNGTSGQLGNGSSTNADTPQPVSMPTNTIFVSLKAGSNHVLALDALGTGWVWGANGNGTLGTGSEGSIVVPTRILRDVTPL